MTENTLARRPHFSRKGDALHFGASTRPAHRLDAEEAELWETLDTPQTTGEISPAATRLAEAGVIDIFAPFAPDRRPILVIEPHSDDAALSVGGTMWMRRNDDAFEIVTLASRSNYTTRFVSNKGNFDRNRITRLRTEEGAIFARHVGGRYRTLGLSEATMRYADADWSDDFFAGHRIAVSAFNNARAPDAVLEDWTAAVKDLIEGGTWDEIWIPLGAGTHADHDLTRNACLRALAEGAGQGARIRFYLDVPYGAHFPAHRDRLLSELTARGAELTPEAVDVTESWDDKQRLLGVFGSQFKPAAIAHGQDAAAAWGAGDGQRLEHLWEVTRLPEPRDLHELAWPWLEAGGLAGDMGRLAETARDKGRLRVILIDAAGGWPAHLAALRAAAGDVAVEVAASEAARAEIARDPGERVTLTDLPAGQGGRVLALLSTTPTLVVAGDAASKVRQLARWLPGKIVVAEGLSAAILALRAA